MLVVVLIECECFTIRLTEQNKLQDNRGFQGQNINAPRTSTTTRTSTISRLRNLSPRSLTPLIPFTCNDLTPLKPLNLP